jgi:hypothetical protein
MNRTACWTAISTLDWRHSSYSRIVGLSLDRSTISIRLARKEVAKEAHDDRLCPAIWQIGVKKEIRDTAWGLSTTRPDT